MSIKFGIFGVSESNRIKENTVSIRYLSVNFDKKKIIIHIFSWIKQKQRENVIQVGINSGSKLLVILPFIIAVDLKEGLLL